MLSGEISRRFGSAGLPEELSASIYGIGRPEFRRFPGKRRPSDAGRRCQRLCRERAVRRPHRRLPPRQLGIPARAEHHCGKCGPVRRHWGRGVFQRHSRRALCGAAIRAPPRCRGGGRPWLRIHDAGARRSARADGRNFAAGMTGGFAYVLDESGEFASGRCNVPRRPRTSRRERRCRPAGAAGPPPHGADRQPRARAILEHWKQYLSSFVKVFPMNTRESSEFLARRPRHRKSLQRQTAGR